MTMFFYGCQPTGGAFPVASVDPRLRAETRHSKVLCAEVLGALAAWMVDGQI